MDKQIQTIITICIIPQVVSLIAEKEDISEETATKNFYNSLTYKMLAEEDMDLWHYSPLTIYSLYKDEKEKGNIILPIGQS